MFRFLQLLLFVFLSLSLNAQIKNYQSLDAQNPISWYEGGLIYHGDSIQLGPKSLFIDGLLSDEQCKVSPYIFNNFNEACQHLIAGTESEPMRLNIAPYVYWVDNPDDSEIRVAKDGGIPYGLEIDCPWLFFNGLTENPENVVLACNRGQTIGAKGNFTMFHIFGDGIRSENITFGNYCNVDLSYPLLPELSRNKRAEAIVQAQLIICNGDKIIAHNCNFISRLNLCNFVGAKRILFDQCHFESTDDALCGTGVYLNCTFDFYSSKPFYCTVGTGAVFLNCDITSYTHGNQYFTKAPGQVAVIDTRIHSKSVEYLGWQHITPVFTKNYQFNVHLNNESIFIGNNYNNSTVELNQKELLNAYRITDNNNKIIYNTYNLLKGNDDWDPMYIKPSIQKLEEEKGIQFTDIPTQLLLSSSKNKIETQKDTTVIACSAFRFGDYKTQTPSIKWFTSAADSAYVKLIPSANAELCSIIPINHTNIEHQVIVNVQSEIGLEAAIEIVTLPEILASPTFSKIPHLSKTKNSIILSYTLNSEFTDSSEVSWYRCSDKKGNNAIEVAKSHTNNILKEYRLTQSDVGYYIMAQISPKNIRSLKGEPITVIWNKKIQAKDISSYPNSISTDFSSLSVQNQEEFIPGFWTLSLPDSAKSERHNANAWTFDKGYDGAENMVGLVPTGREANLFYTPLVKQYGDMKVTLKISPFKTAGQGFSVAHKYMDVLIKYDGKTGNGYGLRLIRTTKYGNAVDGYFVEYKNGSAEKISESHSISCYRAICTISLNISNNILSAKVSSTSDYNQKSYNAKILTELNQTTQIKPNYYGGFGIIYNGGSKAIINHIELEWPLP